MESRWDEAEARRTVEALAAKGHSEDVALRVYSTRLLGADPRLVLHGGGNTSVKTRVADLMGEMQDVLCVKGSGWDMAVIEPAGLPAVKLAPLRALRTRNRLTDEDMVAIQRANLIDPAAPNPSVETLLHAFLPHTFVDHTHASAVLALVDQPNGAELVGEVWGDTLGFVPYVIPGFDLAKAAATVFEQSPKVEGLVLHKHGIFTFGATAREAYERMIAHVTHAEVRLARGRRPVFRTAALPADIAPVSALAPIIRGACAVPAAGSGEPGRFVLEFRNSPRTLDYVRAASLAEISQRGVVTPDHIIRTKNFPLLLPAASPGDLAAFKRATQEAVARFATDYDAMFARQNARVGGIKTKLDPRPRVVLVAGVGLFGLGATPKDARIAADLGETAIDVITDAEAVGTFEALGEADLFDLEYWSLEQAKLKGAKTHAFTGQVVAVTGGAGGIGRATARAFAAEGASVAVLDRDQEAATQVAKNIGGLGLACDVTDKASVQAAFARICEAWGGLDILVSNAGAAWQGRIGEVSDKTLRDSFELNFFAHQNVAQAATAILRAQGTGGVLLFNISKQAINPGADFGPYGLPKAATLALMRQYALDYGAEGIRANGVNADRIRTGLLDDAMIAARSKARGVTEAEYMGGNLLKREVTADDVGQAFVTLAKSRATTGHVLTVDGGNIAAALR